MTAAHTRKSLEVKGRVLAWVLKAPCSIPSTVKPNRMQTDTHQKVSSAVVVWTLTLTHHFCTSSPDQQDQPVDLSANSTPHQFPQGFLTLQWDSCAVLGFRDSHALKKSLSAWVGLCLGRMWADQMFDNCGGGGSSAQRHVVTKGLRRDPERSIILSFLGNTIQNQFSLSISDRNTPDRLHLKW